jgi:hypothetical protein
MFVLAFISEIIFFYFAHVRIGRCFRNEGNIDLRCDLFLYNDGNHVYLVSGNLFLVYKNHQPMRATLLLLFASSGLSLLMAAQVSLQWNNFPGGVSLALDSSDHVYSAYWDYNPAGDITVVKRNTHGEVIWQSGFNNVDNTRHEVATWVATDSEGMWWYLERYAADLAIR